MSIYEAVQKLEEKYDLQASRRVDDVGRSVAHLQD